MNFKYFKHVIISLALMSYVAIVGSVETITYYHNDALGSPVAATDEAGNLKWREEYLPYGERLLKEDNGQNDTWYTGKQEDKATGLSYFGARWYDPVIGRFTGIDPVGFKEGNIQSFNRYAYANNNPYKFIDPDGREVKLSKGVVLQPDVLKAFKAYNNYIGKSHDVVVVGGNRDKNSKLGAGKNSQHAKNKAGDFVVPGTTHLEAANAALKSGLFSGVGWYQEGFRGPKGEGPHVHGDIRTSSTTENPSKWGYAKGSKKATAIPKFTGTPTLTVNKKTSK